MQKLANRDLLGARKRLMDEKLRIEMEISQRNTYFDTLTWECGQSEMKIHMYRELMKQYLLKKSGAKAPEPFQESTIVGVNNFHI
jgi:phage shock protein A